MSRVKVLVVEDEPILAFVMEDIIKGLGYEVIAKTAALSEAKQVASSIEVDLAILDINLYGEKSYIVAEILLTRGIPFIFVTGSRGDTMPASLGHAAKLTKPISSSDVARAISEAMAP
jgi:CheY-like chemotaxis protein